MMNGLHDHGTQYNMAAAVHSVLVNKPSTAVVTPLLSSNGEAGTDAAPCEDDE